MNICAISDLHGNLNFKISNVEVLFICGDISPLYIQRNHRKSRIWIEDIFIPWLNEQPVKKVFLVGGNHDFCLENIEKSKALFKDTKVSILYNEGEEYTDSLNKTWTIWGSPLCHQYGNWAFMWSDEEEEKEFNKMPDNVDFLITHDAAYGRNDICFQLNNNNHIGNVTLARVLEVKKPKYHFTGHLHSSNHILTDYNGTQTACVSLLDENYSLVFNPLYLTV